MARIASWIDARTGQPGLLAADCARSRWSKGELRRRIKAAILNHTPVGYEDDAGFHYGAEPIPSPVDARPDH